MSAGCFIGRPDDVAILRTQGDAERKAAEMIAFCDAPFIRGLAWLGSSEIVTGRVLDDEGVRRR
jgi:hypothetical protein